jgi:glycosyltransferase involved in cell wall biosynthesis
MTRTPRLSIGLPVRNGEQYLAEALDALLGQSYGDFELIISDNASTDGTEAICRRDAGTDRRIRYIRQQRNIGRAGSHNMVFMRSRGELFKWASDDELRRVHPYGSYCHADRPVVAERALHGPFHQVPEWLYFRRDHPGAAVRGHPGIRAWCANYHARRADRLRHPVVRLVAEYVWAYVAAIRAAPLSSADRVRCYQHLATWLADRARPCRKARDGSSRPADLERPVPVETPQGSPSTTRAHDRAPRPDAADPLGTGTARGALGPPRRGRPR